MWGAACGQFCCKVGGLTMTSCLQTEVIRQPVSGALENNNNYYHLTIIIIRVVIAACHLVAESKALVALHTLSDVTSNNGKYSL